MSDCRAAPIEPRPPPKTCTTNPHVPRAEPETLAADEPTSRYLPWDQATEIRPLVGPSDTRRNGVTGLARSDSGYPERSFDVVVLHTLLSHVDEPARVLKPRAGGDN